MPAQCCVGGCKKETIKDGVTHHYFPKDPVLTARWVNSVANSRKYFKGPGTSHSQVVCSDHFKEECFTQTYRTKKSLGLDYKNYKPKLEKDAVPTLFHDHVEAADKSNEVKGGSVNMEKEGLIRVVDGLAKEDLDIKMLVTVRHVQIQKSVRENLTDTEHCYDVWHIAKAVKKKLMAIAKTKDCEDVGDWVKSISNYLYWCAASSQDSDMIVSKWKSVSNHIQNVHSGHEGKFSECQHGDIGPRKWLEPSSKAACKVEDYIIGTRLSNDVRKLSTQYQTSDLESYHSVVNHFAPKLYSFDYNPQLSRMKVAALHFNENTARQQAVTKAGALKTKVTFPKFKKGEFTIKLQKEEPTYRYVDTLIDDVLSRGWQKMDKAQLLKTPIPPPLCNTMKMPSKAAIQVLVYI